MLMLKYGVLKLSTEVSLIEFCHFVYCCFVPQSDCCSVHFWSGALVAKQIPGELLVLLFTWSFTDFSSAKVSLHWLQEDTCTFPRSSLRETNSQAFSCFSLDLMMLLLLTSSNNSFTTINIFLVSLSYLVSIVLLSLWAYTCPSG